MTFLSVLLAFALIFTAMPLTAAAENEEASAVNTGTSGEYTLSQLADMQVSDDDIPATLTRADIDAKDHAVRLRSEEPNDATVIFQFWLMLNIK